MAQFTEGPWYLTQSEAGAPRYIREEASDAVLAYVEDGGHVDPQFALPEEEQLANGNLMAAAPALYKQVELFVSTIEYSIRKAERDGDDEGARLQSLTLNLAKDALARARGEKQLETA